MPAGVERQDGKDYLILCTVQARDFLVARFSDQSQTLAKFEAEITIDSIPLRSKAACSSVTSPRTPDVCVFDPKNTSHRQNKRLSAPLAIDLDHTRVALALHFPGQESGFSGSWIRGVANESTFAPFLVEVRCSGKRATLRDGITQSAVCSGLYPRKPQRFDDSATRQATIHGRCFARPAVSAEQKRLFDS